MDYKKYEEEKEFNLDGAVEVLQEIVKETVYQSYFHGYLRGLHDAPQVNKTETKLGTNSNKVSNMETKAKKADRVRVNSDEDYCDGNCVKCDYIYNSQTCKDRKSGNKNKAKDKKTCEAKVEADEPTLDDLAALLIAMCL